MAINSVQKTTSSVGKEVAGAIFATQNEMDLLVVVPWSVLWATVAYLIFSRSVTNQMPQQPEPQNPPPSPTTHL
jgi:hypothetical protein